LKKPCVDSWTKGPEMLQMKAAARLMSRSHPALGAEAGAREDDKIPKMPRKKAAAHLMSHHRTRHCAEAEARGDEKTAKMPCFTDCRTIPAKQFFAIHILGYRLDNDSATVDF